MNKPEKPLRIALVIPHLGGGGAERSVLQLARGLIERGHAVDILVFKKIDTLEDEFPPQARQFILKPGRVNGFRDRIRLARRFGFRILRFLRRDLLKDARAVAAYIDEERPDCILPSLPGAKSATLLALCFTRLNPVTIPTVRIVLMNTKRRFRKLYAILFPTADHIVAVSDGVADNVALKLGIPRERISRIYNPVVSAEIAELARAVPDHPWTSDDGPPVILGAGRLARVKDFPTLLRAFRRVSRNREVRLIILGGRKLAETPGKHDPQNGTGKNRLPARLGPEPLRLHEPRLVVRPFIQAGRFTRCFNSSTGVRLSLRQHELPCRPGGDSR